MIAKVFTRRTGKEPLSRDYGRKTHREIQCLQEEENPFFFSFPAKVVYNTFQNRRKSTISSTTDESASTCTNLSLAPSNRVPPGIFTKFSSSSPQQSHRSHVGKFNYPHFLSLNMTFFLHEHLFFLFPFPFLSLNFISTYYYCRFRTCGF